MTATRLIHNRLVGGILILVFVSLLVVVGRAALADNAAPAKITVTATGPVLNPGSHALIAGARLDDLMQAAAPSLEAGLDHVQVERRSPDGSVSLSTYDFAAFLDRHVDADNPPLADGDTVIVPRKAGVPITVNVRGEVVHPGRFELTSPATVLDAISAAGGPTSNANKGNIVVQHAGSMAKEAFDYPSAVQSPTDTNRNPVLIDDDSITVPIADQASTFTITGAVLHPGEYSIDNPSMTLADAIGKAGGLGDHAKVDKILVLRTDKTGQPQKIAINAKDPGVQKKTVVMAGDNINIPQGAPPEKLDPLELIGTAVSVIAIVKH